MPSVIQKKSYNSAKVFWLNRDLLLKNLNRCVKNLINKRPEVQKAILFGSLTQDRALPASDVDLMLIVSESNQRFIDRFLTYIDFFEELGVGLDIFVYTQKEIAANDIPLVTSALKKGKVLFEK